MLLYLINLLVVSLLVMLSTRVYISYDKKIDLHNKRKLPNLFFISIALVCMMSVYSLRWYVGSDFGNYYYLYFYYGNMSVAEVIGVRDWGFYIVSTFMYKIFPDNFIVYNYVLAALTFIPVMMTLRKNSTNFFFSVVLYITMMMYYSGFNGVRQAIAVSICFAAYPLLVKKKWLLYIAVIILASTFHTTALLLIPLMFITARKAWSKISLIIIFLLLITIVFLPSLWTYVINFLEQIGQEKLADDYKNFKYSDEGIHILRLLVAATPVIFSLLFYRRIKKNSFHIDVLINMSLLFLVFMLFGTQMTVLSRLASYFGIFNILLIPELSKGFKTKDQKLFQIATITLFIIYMIILLPIDSDLIPYEFNISD